MRVALFALCLSLAAPGAFAQEGLDAAKELYLAASYDEALTALDRIAERRDGEASIEVKQYRAFCLLALQRTDDAKAVIEEIYDANPMFEMNEAQTPPRVQTAFRDVRREALPGIVQREYAKAKDLFDKKDPRSTAQFERVLTLLDDPDLEGKVVPDFRTVVSGFRDLSRMVAAPPPPAAAAPAAPTQTAPSAASRPAAGGATPAPASGDPGVVVPPVAITRQMPRWEPLSVADAARVYTGQLALTLDARGNVVSAELDAPVYPSYDQQLLRAARQWKFKPATRNGVAVPFVVIIPIRLAQRQ